MDLSSLTSDGFGFWLAGLIDGEGCFTITPNRPGFICRMSLGLRDDDAAVLETIASRTCLGRVSIRQNGSSGNRKPLAMWRIQKKDDCCILVDLLDAFPLRSKKARDFAIWRKAVHIMASMPPANGRAREWTPVAELKDELTDVRRYVLGEQDVLLVS